MENASQQGNVPATVEPAAVQYRRTRLAKELTKKRRYLSPILVTRGNAAASGTARGRWAELEELLDVGEALAQFRVSVCGRPVGGVEGDHALVVVSADE